MNLTPKLADKIADRYRGDSYYTGKTALDKALAIVIKRRGGLCAALTEDARRDLILTLGDNRRLATRKRDEAQARISERRAALDGAVKQAAE